MGEREALLTAIEAVHRAGLEPDQWPAALVLISNFLGSRIATLETFDRSTFRHVSFHASELPPGNMESYLEHYSALNPRAAHAFRHPEREFLHDYDVLDEAAIARDPFYQEFLAPTGLRYFLSGMVERSRPTQTILSVQRSARQGHAQAAEIDRLRLLLPHVRQATDVGMRLAGAGRIALAPGAALDLLGDGVIVIAADCRLVHANTRFERIARAEDGIRLVKGVVSVLDPGANAAMTRALGAFRQLREDPAARVAAAADFLVPRPSGAQPYIVAMRPLPPAATDTFGLAGDPMAILFIRDPRRHLAAVSRTAREIFSLTEAEARLAAALRDGIPPNDYARAFGLSRNTVYTHLRRIKEKLGCSRTIELVRRLNDLQLPMDDDGG